MFSIVIHLEPPAMPTVASPAMSTYDSNEVAWQPSQFILIALLEVSFEGGRALR